MDKIRPSAKWLPQGLKKLDSDFILHEKVPNVKCSAFIKNVPRISNYSNFPPSVKAVEKKSSKGDFPYEHIFIDIEWRKLFGKKTI